MHKLILIALMTIGLFSSCHKSPKCWGEKTVNSGIIINSFNPCDNCTLWINKDSSFVINSNNDYLKLYGLANSNNSVCQFNQVNFNDYTLLGKSIWTKCKTKVLRDLAINTVEKKYIYTITAKECGNCPEENRIDSWILAPKIPSGYSVDFIYIRK